MLVCWLKAEALLDAFLDAESLLVAPQGSSMTTCPGSPKP